MTTFLYFLALMVATLVVGWFLILKPILKDLDKAKDDGEL